MNHTSDAKPTPLYFGVFRKDRNMAMKSLRGIFRALLPGSLAARHKDDQRQTRTPTKGLSRPPERSPEKPQNPIHDLLF